MGFSLARPGLLAGLNALTGSISNPRTRVLVRTIVTPIKICHRRRIQQSFSLLMLIGQLLPGTPSLPSPQRLPLLSLSRLYSQAIPRGTRTRTCTPTYPPIYSTKTTADYLPRPDQTINLGLYSPCMYTLACGDCPHIHLYSCCRLLARRHICCHQSSHMLKFQGQLKPAPVFQSIRKALQGHQGPTRSAFLVVWRVINAS